MATTLTHVCGSGEWIGTPIGNGWLPPTEGSIPTIRDIIEELTGKIDASDLAISLKTEIETIAVVRQSLLAEIALRIKDGEVLAGILADVDKGISDALTYMYNETQERVTADSAALSAFNVMAAAIAGSIASQSSSLDLLVKEDEAIAQSVDELAVQLTDPVTGLAATRASLVNDYYVKSDVDSAIGLTNTQLRAYSNLGSRNFKQSSAPLNRGSDPATSAAVPLLIGDTWIDTSNAPNTTTPGNTLKVWSGTAWVPSKDSGIAAVDARVSTVETSKIGYCSIGVNGVPTDHKDKLSCEAAGHIWNVGLPLASAVKQVTVSDPNGGTAKLEVAMTAQKTLNDGLKAQYTVKLNANGMIGGFGLYGDATGISAGFDVDSFWIGRTNSTKVKPFIIDNGIVYINKAAVGLLTADQIDTRGLSIKDSDGRLILGSGTALDYSDVTGAGKPADNASRNQVFRQSTTPSGATTNDMWFNTSTAAVSYFNGSSWVKAGDVTSSNTAAAITGQGIFATAPQLTAANLSTYMAGAAISQAFIGNAAIGTAQIGDLQVNTLKIANSSVTISTGNSTQSGNKITAAMNLAYPANILVIGTVNAPRLGFAQRLTIVKHRTTNVVVQESVNTGTICSFVYHTTSDAGYFSAEASNSDPTGHTAGVVILASYK